MSYNDLRGALRHYNATAVESGIENAGPHRLVQMLMAGALEKVADRHHADDQQLSYPATRGAAGTVTGGHRRSAEAAS